MAIVPSYYDDLAASQNLQLIIDRSQDVLSNTTLWRQWLTLAPTQYSLKFDTIIGRDRISAAASIVDEDAPAPLRSRNKLERYSGNIPTMKEKFVMKQSEMREILILRNLPIVAGGGSERLIQFLINDLNEAAVAGEKRVDIMLLQAMSTLTIDLGITANPDGVSYGTIDLLPQTYQKQGVPVVWTDLANATPIDDIKNYIEQMSLIRGRIFGQIVMTTELWYLFRQTAQVKAFINSFFFTGRPNGGIVVTIDTVNEYFASNGWPPLTLVNYTSMYESDGQAQYFKPFNINNVMFAPSGPIGTLANAYSMEALNPVEGKTYANFGPTLVSKWRDDDPLREFTSMEMLAIPALAIDSIFLLTTNVVQGGGFV